MIENSTGQAIFAWSRIDSPMICLAFCKHTDNSSRWELDRCRAGWLQRPGAPTGLRLSTVLANREPDASEKMNDQVWADPHWVFCGASEMDYYWGGLLFVSVLETSVPCKWMSTNVRFVRVSSKRCKSMPLVIINQWEVKAVITFHMVRELLQQIYYHSQH